MGMSSQQSALFKIVQIGEWSEAEYLGERDVVALSSTTEDQQLLTQVISRHEHSNVVLILAPTLKRNEFWENEIAHLRQRYAIVGIGSEEERASWADCCDAMIKVEHTESACAILSAMSQLTATRRELDRASSALTQQYRLMDQVAMAIIGADLNGVVKAWNHRAQTMFGIEAEMAMGQPLNLFFKHSDGREFSMQKILEPLLIRDRHQFDSDISLRDGSVMPVHFSLSLEKNSNGDIIGVICCCRDISLRRRVEGERRDAFQRLSFFLESMPLGFVEWGADFKIRAWNHSAEVIFGYGQKEALGKSFRMLVRDDFVDEARAIFKAMRDSKEGSRNRNENLTRDGRVIICDWTNTALLDEKGEVVGYASIVDDVTERMEIEEELKQSRESAHAANRSKDEFLAVMSHEVRTPMNSIIGFADLLMESLKDNQEQSELVNIIKANAFNLLELISNVLNYSRLEAGEVTLKEQETDLTTLCHEIQEVCQAEALEKGLSFEVNIHDETPRSILADYSELRQVLLNLTANALKFTEEGAVSITVSAQPQPTDNPWRWELIFAVKDTGIGINEVDRDKLFQSFTQLDSSSTRRFGGTGLGLAICRRIVELWEGRIWAESNRGQGSTFYFTLPTQESSGGVADTSSPLYEEIEDGRFAEIYPMQILLLTPTRATAEVVEHIMASLGYAPEVQYDAIEAISYMQDHAFDVILIDEDLKDFTLAEVVELISEGQAGEANREAQLGVLYEHGTHNKESGAPFGSSVIEIAKPIIARNMRITLRKIAIGRDSTQSKA